MLISSFLCIQSIHGTPFMEVYKQKVKTEKDKSPQEIKRELLMVSIDDDLVEQIRLKISEEIETDRFLTLRVISNKTKAAFTTTNVIKFAGNENKVPFLQAYHAIVALFFDAQSEELTGEPTYFETRALEKASNGIKEVLLRR